MAPLRRRSWAPRGHTPRLRQRTRLRRKVSVIAALVISPRRHRVRGYFGLQPDANYDGEAILAFLKELRRTLRVPLTLVWDRLRAIVSNQSPVGLPIIAAMYVLICCHRTRRNSTRSN